jgi:hypothetical protein
MQPLRIEAKWLSPDPSTKRSKASSPDIDTLLEVFDEPLRDGERRASTPAKPTFPGSGPRLLPGEANRTAQASAPKPVAAPATKGFGPHITGLILALVGIALVPMAILFVLLWQDMMRPERAPEAAPGEQKSAARLPQVAQPEHVPSPLEVVLSSPDRIDANAGAVVAFPIAIDATDALPVRSIIAVTALPEGATFSAGRPYGGNGWSLRPDEIGDLQLRLAGASSPAALRLELVAGDGAVLAQSETRLSIDPPAAEIATVASVDSAPTDAILRNPFEQVATAETTGSIDNAPEQAVAKAEPAESGAESPSLPRRKPASSAANSSGVKVNTVKVVTIEPPRPTRPHDGAFALGSPADASGEWMETKTAVDMHAKAEQSSETVKIIAQGGIKLRVMARDKNWVQVNDPKTSTTGWIYNRFLKPTEPPAR